MNHNALWIFRVHVGWLWHRMRRFITRWLPPPSVCHPYPLRRMGVITQGKSRMPESRLSESVEGVMSDHDSYSDFQILCDFSFGTENQ